MTNDLDRALEMIAKRRFARSDDIAHSLQLAPETVCSLLQPAVESGYLVACKVIRPGKPDAFDYRIAESASGAAQPMSFADFTITARPKAAAKPLKQHQAVRRPTASPVQPSEPIMAKQMITRQQVIAAITAAGKDGISRSDLAAQFHVPVSNIDFHITALIRLQPPVIFKPTKGVVTAIEFKDAAPARIVQTYKDGTRKLSTWPIVLEWLAAAPEGTAGTVAAIAQATGCTEDSTNKVLLGLYTGMKCERIRLPDGDFAYYVGELAADTAAGVAGGCEASDPAPGEDAVAPHRDSAQSMAHGGAAVGVSDQPPVPALTPSSPDAVALITTTADQPFAGPSMTEAEVANFANLLEPEADTWPPRAPAYPEASARQGGWPFRRLANDEASPNTNAQAADEHAENLDVTAPGGFDEVVFADAAMTEMAVWSNGALTIDDGATTVQLSVDVTRKLRNYLGLFQESAPC